MEARYTLEGSRKLLVLVGVFLFAGAAAYAGLLTDQLVHVIETAAAFFFGANGLEHIGRGLAAGRQAGQAARDLHHVIYPERPGGPPQVAALPPPNRSTAVTPPEVR